MGAPVDGRMSSSVTSLYPLDASGTCPSKCDKHKYLQTWRFRARGGETTLAAHHWATVRLPPGGSAMRDQDGALGAGRREAAGWRLFWVRL